MINLTASLNNCGFDPIMQIAAGYIKNVILACSQESGLKVALKIINKMDVSQERVDRELEISALLRNPNIVQTLKVYQDRNFAFIVMEKINASLYQYMDFKGRLSELQSRKLFSQLTRAVDYMHNNVRIAHGGITCDNILVDNNLNLKLADFCQSDYLTSSSNFFQHESWGSFSGKWRNLHYYGPEVLTRKSFDLEKVDMFSLGIVLYYTLMKRFPPRNDEYGVDTEDINMSPLSGLCHDLLVSLLNPNLKMRFAVEEALEHKWVTKKPSLVARFLSMFVA